MSEGYLIVGRGGGIVVGISAFHFEDPSSIPAKNLTFVSVSTVTKVEDIKKAGGSHPFIIKITHSVNFSQNENT